MDLEKARQIFSLQGHVSKAELTKMYRRLSIKVHPDHNQKDPDSSKKFQDLSAAYMLLCSALENPDNQVTTLDKMVNDFKPSRLSKPPAVVVFLTLSLEQSYTGTLSPVDITRWVEKDELRETETETIYVETPRGVDNGEVIILTGKGNRRGDGEHSDVKIFVKIEPHTCFKRKGLDLKYTHTMDLISAYKGFTFKINHLNGEEYKFKVSRFPVQPGSVTIIPELGMARGDYKGKLEIEFNLILDEKPSDFVQSLEKWFIGPNIN